MPRYDDAGIGVAVVLGQACARLAASAPLYSFPLLCDERREVIRRYGVWHPIGIDAFNIARPAAFLIDAPTRAIRYSFVGSSQFERAPLEKILDASLRPPADDTR